MSFIRTLVSIGSMIVVIAMIAEFLVMPVYTRHNQNRIMMDVQYKMLDEVVPVSYTHLTLPTNREV